MLISKNDILVIHSLRNNSLDMEFTSLISKVNDCTIEKKHIPMWNSAIQNYFKNTTLQIYVSALQMSQKTDEEILNLISDDNRLFKASIDLKVNDVFIGAMFPLNPANIAKKGEFRKRMTRIPFADFWKHYIYGAETSICHHNNFNEYTVEADHNDTLKTVEAFASYAYKFMDLAFFELTLTIKQNNFPQFVRELCKAIFAVIKFTNLDRSISDNHPVSAIGGNGVAVETTGGEIWRSHRIKLLVWAELMLGSLTALFSTIQPIAFNPNAKAFLHKLEANICSHNFYMAS